MKKTVWYHAPGFKLEVWNDTVRLQMNTNDKRHTRAELLEAWAEANEKAIRVLSNTPETLTSVEDIVDSVQKPPGPLDK